jgi:hypothetical protein
MMKTVRQTLFSKKRSIWLIIAAVVGLSFVVLVCVYRRFLLSGLDLVAEATGSRLTAALSLTFVLLVLAWTLVWMLFPIFVYFSLKDLRRRAAELERATSSCASLLAQLAAERHESKPQPAPEPQAPGTESP